METLNEMSGENVNLAIRQDDYCRYIELVESKHLLRPHFTIDDYYPLYCTSLGRCLLSDLQEAEIDTILPAKLEARTPFALTDRAQIQEKIQQVRSSHHAIDDEEFYLGLFCIGSPIYGIGNKVVAALSVIAPKVRMDEATIEKLIPHVIDTAKQIGQEYNEIFLKGN